jgi:hypothetical protein
VASRTIGLQVAHERGSMVDHSSVATASHRVERLATSR